MVRLSASILPLNRERGPSTTDLEAMISPSSSPRTTSRGDRIRPPTDPPSEITTRSLELTSPRKWPSIRIGSWNTRRPATLILRLTATRARSSIHDGKALATEEAAASVESLLRPDKVAVTLGPPSCEFASEIRMLATPFTAPGIHDRRRHGPRTPQSNAARLVCRYLSHKGIADGSYSPPAD